LAAKNGGEIFRLRKCNGDIYVSSLSFGELDDDFKTESIGALELGLPRIGPKRNQMVTWQYLKEISRMFHKRFETFCADVIEIFVQDQSDTSFSTRILF